MYVGSRNGTSSKKNPRRPEQKSLVFISLLYSTYFIILNLFYSNFF